MLLEHGGNITKVINTYKINSRKVIDFSSNINPAGITSDARKIISNTTGLLSHYPDPECSSARVALSDYLGINKNNILIGNGSNELIHLIPRALGCRDILIYQPVFSEYEASARLSGARIRYLFARETDGFRINLGKIIKCVSNVGLIILCNPNNPTGFFLKKNELLELIRVCSKNRTYLLIDETFIEFIEGDCSLVKEAARYKYLLVLRSLTKFFSVPGLRIGYLVADKKIIKRVSLLQPTWSVNSFAQAIVTKTLLDKSFIRRSRDYVRRERNYLYKNFKKIKGISPYYSKANFVFCKITNQRYTASSLFKKLLKYGILIRDCSNFKGLGNCFFRVAVRKRKDNRRLIFCLAKIFR